MLSSINNLNLENTQFNQIVKQCEKSCSSKNISNEEQENFCCEFEYEDRAEISQLSKNLLKKEKESKIKELTDEEKREVQQLKQEDAKVKRHEQAHLSAAGGLATSGAQYEYEIGPDGQKYAVSGEVNISAQEGSTPEETIAIAKKLKAAALAPEDPSSQDRAVARKAAAMEADATKELQKEQTENDEKEDNKNKPKGSLVDAVA